MNKNQSHAEIILGDQEAIGGWDYGKSGVQRIAGPLWSPGSRAQSQRAWVITAEGTWCLVEPIYEWIPTGATVAHR